jgi:hypothetical protein
MNADLRGWRNGRDELPLIRPFLPLRETLLASIRGSFFLRSLCSFAAILDFPTGLASSFVWLSRTSDFAKASSDKSKDKSKAALHGVSPPICVHPWFLRFTFVPLRLCVRFSLSSCPLRLSCVRVETLDRLLDTIVMDKNEEARSKPGESFAL